MILNIAIYLDNNYAIPATAMIRSLLDNLSVTDNVRLFALALDLPTDVKQIMEGSWNTDRIKVHWIDLDWSSYEQKLPPVGYLSRAAYARILIDRYLPLNVDRVITIDCDGIVLDDMGKLWRVSHSNHPVMAVQDPCIARLNEDPSSFLQNQSSAKDAPYFNSGLMSIDLKKWRFEGISDLCLELAARHVGQAAIGDQSLLNAVLQRNWGSLNVRWNCNRRHLNIHSYPLLRNRVYPYSDVLEAIRNPGFIHFLSRRKPWNWNIFHPHQQLYREYMHRTLWQGEVAPQTLTLKVHLQKRFQKMTFPWLCWRQYRELVRKWETS